MVHHAGGGVDMTGFRTNTTAMVVSQAHDAFADKDLMKNDLEDLKIRDQFQVTDEEQQQARVKNNQKNLENRSMPPYRGK
jgi:phage terminase Nu1 subunit (DNA packaging protein)